MPVISPIPDFSATFFFSSPESPEKITEITDNQNCRPFPKTTFHQYSKTQLLAFNSSAMSDVPLSKRARKKQAQMSQSGTRSESVGSDTIRKDHPATSTASSPAPELDGELKPREGSNPFIEVVQKKIRNLTKRKVIGLFLFLYYLENFGADFSLDSS
jgi:hypothetical protein